MEATAPATQVHSKQYQSKQYQLVLVLLLSVNFGILFFDRNALNFLIPYVKADLNLTNTQVGLLGSALSLTWALSGYFIGRYSDRTGKRKSILVAATLAFSLCSFISGIAASFLMLLGARLLMGVAEGGVLPISQSIVADEVEPQYRGTAMGVMQNLGSNLLGSTAAPLILVPLALVYGWQHSFFLAGIPGLISSAILWRFLQNDKPPAAAAAKGERLSLIDAFRERNILLCAIIAILLVAYLVICWSFMQLWLIDGRHFDDNEAKWLMAVLGVSAGVGSFVVPAISDRIGRKPVMIAVPLIGVILPLGAMFFDGSLWIMAGIFFLGWALNGVFPMFMATIPSETVDPRHTATALGVVMGAGEVFGGVLGPFAAGAAADQFGAQAPMWIMAGLCTTAAALALGLRETAPRVIARQQLAMA